MKPIRFRWREKTYELNLHCFFNLRCPAGAMLCAAIFGSLFEALPWAKASLASPGSVGATLLFIFYALRNLRVSIKAARLGHLRAMACCGLLTLFYFMLCLLINPFPAPQHIPDFVGWVWFGVTSGALLGGLWVGRGAFAAACPQRVSLR